MSAHRCWRTRRSTCHLYHPHGRQHVFNRASNLLAKHSRNSFGLRRNWQIGALTLPRAAPACHPRTACPLCKCGQQGHRAEATSPAAKHFAWQAIASATGHLERRTNSPNSSCVYTTSWHLFAHAHVESKASVNERSFVFCHAIRSPRYPAHWAHRRLRFDYEAVV